MENHKFFHFLQKQWPKLLCGFLIIVAVAPWSEHLFSTNKRQYQQDFLIANLTLEQFQKGKSLPLTSIETVETILKRHPELHPKYATMLAMAHVEKSNPEKALSYVQRSLQQVSQDFPLFYQHYAHTSLLITEKKHEEAYREAQNLRSYLLDEGDESYSTLYGMNLLRILSLEHTLETLHPLAEPHSSKPFSLSVCQKLRLGERPDTWEELKAHPVYPKILPLLQQGSLTFEEWYTQAII